MPPMGFETRIPVFNEAKRVHALDRTATVICERISGAALCHRASPDIAKEPVRWAKGPLQYAMSSVVLECVLQ
jgi:hypothetical protein